MRPLYAALIAPMCIGCASNPAPAVPGQAEIPALEAEVGRDSTRTQSALRLAQAYRAANQLDAAARLLERVLARSGNESNALLLLGATYEDLGRFGDARRLYRSYIDRGGSSSVRTQLTKRLPLLQRKELEVLVKATVAREAELANTPPQPWTVAVFPFQFVGDDPQYAPLGRALAEFLVNDLSQTSRLKVVERAQVQLLLDEMKLGASGAVDPATAARTGRMLGAERVVQGSIDGSVREVQLQTSIVRVIGNQWPGEATAGAAALSETDALAALSAMQKRLALKIYSSLGIVLTEAEQARVSRRATENLAAILAYGRGLQSEDAGDFATAARNFAESAALDPNFAAARASANRVNDAAAAASVNTSELAASASPEAAPAQEDFFLPSPITRDAAAEILRTEGAGRATILDIIIRRR